MKKHWYDYLWIASLLYLVWAFFNILFAWLGLMCFFIPLLFAGVGGTKVLQPLLGRGQLFGCWADGSACPASGISPRWMKRRSSATDSRSFFCHVLPDAVEHHLVFAWPRT
jgi:hypothetical protein